MSSLDVRESIALARDAIILLVSTVVILVTVVLYLKVSNLLKSAKRTIKYTEDLTSSLSSKGVVFGAGKLGELLLGLLRNKNRGGKNNGK